MTTPLNLLDDQNQGLTWQQVAQKRRERWQNTQQQDTIVPDAAGLDAAGLYGRIGTIRSDSASATQGAVAAAETKRQYEQALQAAKIQKQQQQALMDAYNAMNSIASGAGFGQPGFAGGGLAGGSGGGWGAGGPQGVANLMRAVGFPDSAIQTGIAITKAESGWNPSAINTSNRNGSIDNGLWQINTIHRGNSWYPTDVNDPLQSTRAAYALWKGAGGKWTDWTVYNTGMYQKYMSLGQGVYPNNGVLQPYVANTGSAGGLRNAIVSQAQTYIGVPYVWGGQSRSGLDCSGLVFSVYNDLKMKIPRLTAQGYTMNSFTRGGLSGITGVRTSVSNLRPGDLVGWNGDSVGRAGVLVGHIAIYAGNGEIIEASGARVRRRRLGNENIFGVALRFPGE